jgi:hypothetical protein
MQPVNTTVLGVRLYENFVQQLRVEGGHIGRRRIESMSGFVLNHPVHLSFGASPPPVCV